jgi:hypothetical protein
VASTTRQSIVVAPAFLRQTYRAMVFADDPQDL